MGNENRFEVSINENYNLTINRHLMTSSNEVFNPVFYSQISHKMVVFRTKDIKSKNVYQVVLNLR